MMIAANKAKAVLRAGGVIAYPTEGVFGLGCLPGDVHAVERLLAIKQREPSKGLILLAADAAQLEGWVAPPYAFTLPAPRSDYPITWIAPAGENTHFLLRGKHTGIAVRITTNPVARSISAAVDSPIVSTSANLSGQAIVRNRFILRRKFSDLVDYIVPGACGPATGPSEIRDLASGTVLRPRL